MRTVIETIKTDVYKFDELSDEAKEKFIEEQRDFEAEFWADEMCDCMKRAMEWMNINIDDYQFDCTGSGYINLSVDDEAEDLEGVRAYAWIVNNCFADVNKSKTFWKGLSKSRKSNIESKDWMDNCPFSGVIYDFAVKDAWEEWCAELKNGFEPSVRDFLDKLENQYLNEWSEEYDGFNEDEARDIAEANNFEFLEDGTIY